jgi:hypothetical protein
MSLATAGLLADTTAVSYTGGSALTFSEKYRDKANLVIQVLADAFSSRRKISFSFKDASPKRPIGTQDASSAYTQQRAQAVISLPVTITDPLTSATRIEWNTATVILSQHPLTPDAYKQELRFLASQLLTDADTTAFYDSGNLS